MKPKIVNFIYFVLGWLLVGASMQISAVFSQGVDNGYSSLYNASLSIVIAIAALVSIIGLAKKMYWSRISAFLVIALQSLATLGLGAYVAVQNGENGLALATPYIIYGLIILFMAYKTYSSKPLQEYLKIA